MADFQIREFFEWTSRILLRCWVMGLVLTLLIFAAFMLGGDSIYRWQGSWFDLSAHEMGMSFYWFIGLTKLCVLIFFFFPWIAIRLVLRKSTV